MKKLFAILMVMAQFLSAAPACAKECDTTVHDLTNNCHPVFGYFFLTSNQCVPGSPGNCSSLVNWEDSCSIKTVGIKVNSASPTEILICKPGIYEVEYILTGRSCQNECCNSFEFALLSNGSLVTGSTYATNSLRGCPEENVRQQPNDDPCEYCSGCDTQLVGRAVLVVPCHTNAILSLVNRSAASIVLDALVSECGNNVSGSIFIKRIACFDK